MKIVINASHHGFGLSEKAIRRLRELGSPLVDRPLLVGEINEEGEVIDWFDGFVHIGAYGDESRADKLLIQVIEELGDEADPPHGKIKIVEIPDDVEWELLMHSLITKLFGSLCVLAEPNRVQLSMRGSVHEGEGGYEWIAEKLVNSANVRTEIRAKQPLVSTFIQKVLG